MTVLLIVNLALSMSPRIINSIRHLVTSTGLSALTTGSAPERQKLSVSYSILHELGVQ